MENQEEILKKLRSGDGALLREAIREIQENGDLTMAGILLEELCQSAEPEREPALIGLLSDIKDSSFRELLIRRLTETTDPGQKTLLLRLVWESSLDYSAHWELFATILAEENFEASLEASTTLENLAGHLSPEQRGKLKKRLQHPAFPADRAFLTENILEKISILEKESEEEEETCSHTHPHEH